MQSLVGKRLRIWGVSYGLIGDLIMGLPCLTYFEKKYPGSYKIWVIENKVKVCADIFKGHPLIDEVYITKAQGGEPFNGKDLAYAKSCDVTTTLGKWKHSKSNWYDEIDVVEETAYMAGVHDLTTVLTEEEMVPKLYKWFKVNKNPKTISIWGYAGRYNNLRSPSEKWWDTTVDYLIKNGYTIYDFGMSTQPKIYKKNHPKVISYRHLSFMEQVKLSLNADVSIGVETGASWVMAAYEHNTITLMTNWWRNHTANLLSLAPIGKNTVNLFGKDSCDSITKEQLLKTIKQF